MVPRIELYFMLMPTLSERRASQNGNMQVKTGYALTNGQLQRGRRPFVSAPLLFYNVSTYSRCRAKKAIRCISPLSEIKVEWRLSDRIQSFCIRQIRAFCVSMKLIE